MYNGIHRQDLVKPCAVSPGYCSNYCEPMQMYMCMCTHVSQAHLADPCELLLELLHQQPLIPHVQAAVADRLLQQVGQRLATKVEALHTCRGSVCAQQKLGTYAQGCFVLGHVCSIGPDRCSIDVLCTLDPEKLRAPQSWDCLRH